MSWYFLVILIWSQGIQSLALACSKFLDTWNTCPLRRFSNIAPLNSWYRQTQWLSAADRPPSPEAVGHRCIHQPYSKQAFKVPCSMGRTWYEPPRPTSIKTLPSLPRSLSQTLNFHWLRIAYFQKPPRHTAGTRADFFTVWPTHGRGFAGRETIVGVWQRWYPKTQGDHAPLGSFGDVLAS